MSPSSSGASRLQRPGFRTLIPPIGYFIHCNCRYNHLVNEAKPPSWVLMVVRVPADPSRHRVAVWRELRRIGALSLGQATWAMPDVPAVTDGLARVEGLAARGGGEALVFTAAGRQAQDGRRLQELFTEQRQEEWAEFLADCGKFDAEIAKEIGMNKLTMAELEEEEQSLERLRRWHTAIRSRDVFGASAAAEADERLAHCAARLAQYTRLVFDALHQM